MSVERSDIPPRLGAWTLAGVPVLVGIACAAVAAFLAVPGGLREAAPHRPAPRAAPMLQASERSDRIAIEARATANLRGARGGIPIDEAMRRTAAAGWDAQP